jgi:alkylhydroperoxidase family enzyme
VPGYAVCVPATMTTDEVLQTMLVSQPDVLDALTAGHSAAWAAMDPRLLELCRLRVAMMLGCDAELAVRTPAATASGLDEATIAELSMWPSSPRFGPADRAVLAFCEQYVIDVGSLDQSLTDDVTEQIGAQGLADLATAVLVIEQRQRLRLGWQRLFGQGFEATIDDDQKTSNSTRENSHGN